MVTPAGGVATNSLYDWISPLDDAQWIELYNTSPCDSIDISCFVLASNMSDSTSLNTGTFLFPGGTIIPPLGLIVVGGNAAINKTFNIYGSINPTFCVSERWWLRDNAGWIALYNQSSAPIDAVYWNDTGTASDLFVYPQYGNDVTADPSHCTCCSSGMLLKAKDINGISYGGHVIPSSNFSICRQTDGSSLWSLSSFNGGTPGACNKGPDSCYALAINFNSTEPLCTNEQNGSITATLIVTGNPLAPYHFLWSTGDTTNSINNISSGNYIVTITDKFGCTLVESYALPDPPAFNASIMGNFPFCPNDTLHLYSNVSDGVYSWSGPSGFSSSLSNLEIFPAVEGNYVLTVTNSNGCIDSTSALITFQNLPIANIGNDQNVCDFNNVVLSNQLQFSNYTYEWIPLNSQDPIVDFKPADFNQNPMQVILEVSACGITSIDTLLLTIEQCNLLIPNVMTPNSDGYNDNFFVTNLEFYPESKLQVYNRWGKKVYEDSKYQNNWDGDQLDDGVYFYILTVPIPFQSMKEFHGTITLLKNK